MQTNRVPGPRLVVATDGPIHVLRAAPGSRVGEGDVAAFISEVASQSLRPGSLVALDVSAVDFFGYEEIEVLVVLHDRIARDGGRFILFGAHGVVRDVLHLAGLDSMIGVFPTERAAIEHLETATAEAWH